VSPDEQTLLDSLPPLSGRSLREVLEQDGLTEEVLKIGPATLGFLIEMYEQWERLLEESDNVTAAHPQIIGYRQKAHEGMARGLAKLQFEIDQLQGIADRLYDGSILNAKILRRMRGKICQDHPDVSTSDANALPLPVACELLTWNVSSAVRPGSAGPAPPREGECSPREVANPPAPGRSRGAGTIFLPRDARAVLAHIASEFQANALKYPTFGHVLVVTPDVEAFGEADIGVAFVFQEPGREIRRLWHEKAEIQVFIDDNFSRGKEAYDVFCALAELAVETLTAHALLEPSEPPPDPSEALWFEAKRSHYAKEWMRFVHRNAKAHPGALPRSASAACLENHRLKQGGVANTLTPGVFMASSLTIERILTENSQQVPEAASPRPPFARQKEPAAPNASGRKTATPKARKNKWKPHKPAGPAVILGKRHEEPRVNGTLKRVLTAARYDVVTALLDAGESGLSGDNLVIKSGHGGAVNTLKTLARSDTDWGSVILLPGQPGGRYRIVGRSDGS
jgi:hypothetical protein